MLNHLRHLRLTIWGICVLLTLTAIGATLPAQAAEPEAPTGEAAAKSVATTPSESSPAEPSIDPGAALQAGLEGLRANSFTTKREAVDAITSSGSPRAEPVLTALMDGNLYIRRSQNDLVIAAPTGSTFTLSDAATGTDLGAATSADIKRIVINNTMRNQLRAATARLRLAATDRAQRRSAVISLLGASDAATLDLLREALEREDDDSVREALAMTLAVADLTASDRDTRLAAIETLSASLHSEVHVRLEQLVSSAAAAGDIETRDAATRALRGIERQRTLYGWVETVFFGLSLGGVLVLAAAGLAITFGVMGVINMAHGELMMLGAYTTWVVQQLMPDHIEMSILVAVPAAFIVAGLTGVLIERGVVRFLHGRPLETLLATFGISLVLQQAVRSVFSPLNRAVETPAWMSGQWVINDALAFTWNRIAIIAFTAIVFLALVAVLRYTRLGQNVRAVSQNRGMARAMGVRAGWVDAATFGLGAGVAGLAGVALSQLTNVGPNLGQAYIVDSFMVVVFGGVGNLWGTLVAGLSLGVANKFLEPVTGAVLAKILVLVFIILFIQRRPRGLFPQVGRSAEA